MGMIETIERAMQVRNCVKRDQLKYKTQLIKDIRYNKYQLKQNKKVVVWPPAPSGEGPRVR
jgi:hypothetical protein